MIFDFFRFLFAARAVSHVHGHISRHVHTGSISASHVHCHISSLYCCFVQILVLANPATKVTVATIAMIAIKFNLDM